MNLYRWPNTCNKTFTVNRKSYDRRRSDSDMHTPGSIFFLLFFFAAVALVLTNVVGYLLPNLRKALIVKRIIFFVSENDRRIAQLLYQWFTCLQSHSHIVIKYSSAFSGGNVKAARLYFELLGYLGGQSGLNTTINTQNNYIQINGTVFSQESIKHLKPEQLNQIENLIKNTNSDFKVTSKGFDKQIILPTFLK